MSTSDLKMLHKIVDMTHKHNLNVTVLTSTHQRAVDNHTGRL